MSECPRCMGEGIVPCPEIPVGDDLCPHEDCAYREGDSRRHVCEPKCDSCKGTGVAA